MTTDNQAAVLIDAAALTTFDVHPDGTHVRINVREQSGLPASLVLSANCANQLMMALPRLVEVAMRNSSKNDALRMVHPLECVYIEGGATTDAGTQQFILTVDTGSGFWASFTASEDMLTTLAKTITSEVIARNLPGSPLTAH